MKRYIKSAKARSPIKQNVYDVCEAMDWNTPTFADKGKYGYICKWGGYSVVDHKALDMAKDRLKEEYGSDIQSWPDEAWSKKRKYLAEARPEAKQMVEDEIAEIYDKTGIQCKLTPQGHLIIPFVDAV